MNLFLAGGLTVCAIGGFFLGLSKEKRAPLRIALGIAIAGFFFLMQGVIGIPWGNHLYPFKLLVVLLTCCLADLGWLYLKHP